MRCVLARFRGSRAGVSHQVIKCTGRGSYQRTRLNAQGGIRGYLTRQKRIQGFATGDLVRAEVPTGKKAGIHIGRVAVRASGSFNIQTGSAVVQGISYKHCRLIQRGDGYGYSLMPTGTTEGMAKGHADFPISSRSLLSRSRAEAASQPCN